MDSLPAELLTAWHRALTESYRRACSEFDWCADFPVIDWDARGFGKAAAAYPAENRISINPVIARNNPNPAFIADTAAHEMAHLVAAVKYRSRNHDRAWKRVAATLGAEPKATGRFDISGSRLRAHKKFAFYCDCSTHQLGATRTKRAREGAVYRCRKCRAVITEHPKTALVE